MVEAEVDPKPVVYARAVSIFSSRTFWVNTASFVVAALSMTEVATLIPVRFATLQAAIIALLNLWLRANTIRPVAFIAPGNVKIVPIPKIDPPAPPAVTD